MLEALRLSGAGQGAEIAVGNLEAERDFLDVRDVVQAYLALLSAAPSLPARSTFNIGSSRTIRIGEILDRLLALGGRGITVSQEANRLRPSEVPRAEIETGAIHAATGWTPPYDIQTTLVDVLADQRWRR